MKLHKSIAFLSISVVGIVAFWLYPGINEANNVTYARVYEDTDVSTTPWVVTKQIPGDTNKIKKNAQAPGKKMKEERIVPEKGLTKVNAKMYSRAVHFIEEKTPADTAEARNEVRNEVRGTKYEVRE